MIITIEVNGCQECPYYGVNRYGYCKKMYKDDAEAYDSPGGLYAEGSSDLVWLFKYCPFGNSCT